MTRHQLITGIKLYPTFSPEEENCKAEFLQLLSHPRCFHRDHIPGHITGSSWIVNQELSRTLLVFHAKLGRWLQPGGHADGEENVLNVALREAEEETGLRKLTLLSSAIFDIDIHPIPERKDFPKHLHYDVRFLLQADENESLTINDESTDIRWVDLNDLGDLTGNNKSIIRMASKTFNFERPKPKAKN